MLTTRALRHFKKHHEGRSLRMLTCYDFQSAQMLAQTSVDIILVGDSLANVVLGMKETLGATPEHMAIFGKAVRRGAPEKFLVIDLPFGTTSYLPRAMDVAQGIMQKTQAQSVKIEGAAPHTLEIIERMANSGIPIMGHIGLTPQSIHQLGGYYQHGKTQESARELHKAALAVEGAGAYALVLECVQKDLARDITQELSIPTIGIGSGQETDGQVLVLNDLLGLSPQRPPSFVQPQGQLFELKKQIVQRYLDSLS